MAEIWGNFARAKRHLEELLETLIFCNNINFFSPVVYWDILDVLIVPNIAAESSKSVTQIAIFSTELFYKNARVNFQSKAFFR